MDYLDYEWNCTLDEVKTRLAAEVVRLLSFVEMPKQQPAVVESSEQSDSENEEAAAEKRRECRACGKLFKTDSALRKHLLSAHITTPDPSKVFVCEDCGKKFTNLKSLNEHLRRHRGVMPFGCELCEFKTVSKKLLNLHTRRSHRRSDQELAQSEQPPIAITESNNKEPEESRWLGNDRDGYKCSVCEYECLKRSAMERHFNKEHEKVQPYTCSICGRTFWSRSSHDYHVRYWHGEKVLCECCGKTYGNKMKLKEHLRQMAQGDKLRVCDVCGKHVKDLISHRNDVHGAIKRPKCTECGQVQRNSRKLKLHLFQVHDIGRDPRKTQVCSSCGKSFYSKGQLNGHLVKEHGFEVDSSNLFACSECEKIFFVQHLLDDHMNIHRGLSPFRCPICDFRTSGRLLLNSHVKKAHNMCTTEAQKMVSLRLTDTPSSSNYSV
jgi:KRAB domain-containing zinc finger protein